MSSLELSSMVNESELLINVVMDGKPKMLRGLNQKVMWSGLETQFISNVDVAPPAKRQNLTYSGTYAERGKPVHLPLGKASRKTSRWMCGYGIAEKAKAVL